MNVRGTMHVGWRYLGRHRRKTALLVATITVSLFLPLAILIVVGQAETHLRARSAGTPLMIGSPGSPLELVFNGLYFSEPDVATLGVGTVNAAGGDGLGLVIPLHARHEVRQGRAAHRVVGTSLDYFDLRELRVADGTLFVRLGDCVLGAGAARSLDVGPGDFIITAPEQVFDLAGVYPLRMQVAGVLAPRGDADDQAIFCDLRTAWIIDGIAHGHQAPAEDEAAVLAREEGGNVVMNASVVEYTQITPDNVASFHFHGDPEDFPVTAGIVVPRDAKAETILLGRYLGAGKPAQLIRPDDVMDELFATVFQVRDLVVAALAAVGVMVAIIVTLVFVLSNRLRAREFESLANLGADRGSVRLLVAFEAGFVLVASVAGTAMLAGGLTLVVPRLLPLLTM